MRTSIPDLHSVAQSCCFRSGLHGKMLCSYPHQHMVEHYSLPKAESQCTKKNASLSTYTKAFNWLALVIDRCSGNRQWEVRWGRGRGDLQMEGTRLHLQE